MLSRRYYKFVYRSIDIIQFLQSQLENSPRVLIIKKKA